MAPRSLFNIILKVLGIFLLKDILLAIPQTITTFILLGGSSFDKPEVWSLALGICLLLIYAAVSFFLIFRTELIIDALKLDRGFSEEKITVNISTEAIIMIAIIVTGAFILIQEIPNFFRLVFSYFRQKRLIQNADISYLVYSAVKIIIALLFIGERKRIVRFILR